MQILRWLWRVLQVILLTIGLAGVPDNIKMWAGWLKLLDQNGARWVLVVGVLALWWLTEQQKVRSKLSAQASKSINLLRRLGFRSPIFLRDELREDGVAPTALSKPHNPLGLIAGGYKSGAGSVSYLGAKPVSNKSLEELLSPVEHLTQRDAASYIKARLGSWIVVSGQVADIYDKGNRLDVWLKAGLQQRSLCCEIPNEQAETVSSLGKGDAIAVVGRMSEVGSWISLVDCLCLAADGKEVVAQF